MKVAMIGSGISAASALRVLIARGVRATVFDCAEQLDPDRQNTKQKLKNTPEDQWSQDYREMIFGNPTVKNSIPKKLAFGSEYFYGDSTADFPMSGNGEPPPVSFAQGGFSAGWGAAILPPDQCDIDDWPVPREDLLHYSQQVLEHVPYSAKDDGLSRKFPLLKENATALKLNRGNAELLRKLESTFPDDSDSLVYGQGRLLTNAQGTENSCRYCGHCMSSCVYDALYKSSDDIEKFHKNGEVDYRPGTTVLELQETDQGVTIHFRTSDGAIESERFDKVFVAAGAVSSTRLILQSKKLFQTEAELKTRGGFIAPLLRFKSNPMTWPDENTQPGLFLEYKIEDVSPHWIHTQLSTPNELIYQKLGIADGQSGIIPWVKRLACEHLVVAFCNMHSAHGDSYRLKLIDDGNRFSGYTLNYERKSNETHKQSNRSAITALTRIAWKIGCVPIFPMIKVNSGSFHVGSSLPMKAKPSAETDTDTLGRPVGWHRVHVVDSSVFPSIPGTTIGLLAMANAARIASECEL